MKTLYEILNVDLSQEYTKIRKLSAVKSIEELQDTELEKEIIAIINKMDIPDDDERHHWIMFFGKKAAADLLTLGKVQPETMLNMGSLPSDDFKETVKIATSFARKWNDETIAAEKELNTNTITDYLV